MVVIFFTHIKIVIGSFDSANTWALCYTDSIELFATLTVFSYLLHWQYWAPCYTDSIELFATLTVLSYLLHWQSWALCYTDSIAKYIK